MQSARFVQAVIIMLMVALAASCAVTKEYTSKIFPAQQVPEKEKQAVALRFLQLDSLENKEEGWVTTDIIMGRDTVSNTLALDNLAKTFPATNSKSDTSLKGSITKKAEAIPDSKTTTTPRTEEPVAKTYNSGQVREKRTRED